MKKYIFGSMVITAIVASLVVACDSRGNRQVEAVKAENQPKSKENLSYGDLIIKEESYYLMIPVYLGFGEQTKDDSLSISRSYKQEAKINNLIFYHKQNGGNNVLLNKSAVINSFDLLEVKTEDKKTQRVWFYRIIDQDTNQDKELNEQDAIGGYISDLSGQNLTQVTPTNSQIVNWFILPSQNAILIKIIYDTNKDKKFTSEDKSNYLRVSLGKPEMGKEIINEQVEKQLKSTKSPSAKN
ncbi:hypothetical protein H6G73_22465 [Richelia sinica FACHB-800]|nr:hypothetical protein [Richelia sinica FACHB-800]